MATTKIWPIRGEIGHVVFYAENEKKTDVSLWTKEEQQGLLDVMEYATDSSKTEKRIYVSGINCDPQIARQQMILTKKRFNKEGKIVAYHGYQSFQKGETTPQQAHDIGVQFAKEMWGDRFQVIVATHLDKEHLHNHFVVNSVSFIDGKKWTNTFKDYYGGMRVISDRLCKENGLSVTKPGNRGTRSHAEWQAEKEGRDTWRGLIRKDIDDAVWLSASVPDFIRNLHKQGYVLKLNVKHIAIKPPGKERYVRLGSLGPGYEMDELEARLKHQARYRKAPEPIIKPHPSVTVLRVRYYGNFERKKHTKLKGIRALYIHYLYLLGIIKKNPQPFKRTAFLFREDLRKLDRYAEQFSLLHENRINTTDDLIGYKSHVEFRMVALLAERRKAYNARYKAGGTVESQELSAKAAQISQELKKLRKELKICEQIKQETVVMRDKLVTVAQERSREKDQKSKDKGGYERS